MEKIETPNKKDIIKVSNLFYRVVIVLLMIQMFVNILLGVCLWGAYA